MVIRNQFSTGFTGREQRLIHGRTDGDNRPFVQRVLGSTANDVGKTIQDFNDPNAARERILTDNRDKLRAFQKDDIFTAPQQLSKAGKGGNEERLLSMTPAGRLEEFSDFVATQIPETVRAKYNFLFTPPITDPTDPRIETLKTAVASLNGAGIPESRNGIAHSLVLDTLAEMNNTAASPGAVYRWYEQWLESRPSPMNVTDATTSTNLLKSDSGIHPELRAYLNHINPAAQKTTLTEMYEIYHNRDTDNNLVSAQARVDYLQLTRSVEKKRIAQESRGFIENFKNADPRLQLVMAGVGAVALWGIWKAKNPVGRWALGAGIGYFAYDRFINGNENALNDMGKGLQKFASTGGNLLKNLGREIGLPIPRNAQDRLDLMADFITENHLSIPGHEAITGMTALSSVKLGEIANAFTPNPNADNLGGELLIEDGSTFVSAGKTPDAGGQGLHQALIAQMRSMGLSGTEQTETINYLKNNNGGVGKAILHAFYMLAMDLSPNIGYARMIEKGLIEYGSYDRLPYNLKQLYMDIALKGRKMAAGNDYKKKSLIDVIATLQAKRNREEKFIDPASDIPNPKESRTAEFALLEETTTLPVSTTVAKDVLDTAGSADIVEFLRNCRNSGILLDDEAANELKKKFFVILSGTPLLSEALQTIEKLKYAIFVQSTKQETALTKEDIILLIGADDQSASSILNSLNRIRSRLSISLLGNFASVSSLGDIRALMKEPWFVSGAVQSTGDGFKRLNEHMDIYDKKMSEMKDAGLVAKKMSSALPDSVVTSFGGREELEKVLKKLVPTSNYRKLVSHAEQHLSQRMANALARTMRLTHQSEGFGKFDDLGITPIEQNNLAREFDVLFSDIMGDPLNGVASMWQNVENIDAIAQYDLPKLEAFDYTSDVKRLEIVQYARELGLIHLLMKVSGRSDPALRAELASRVQMIEGKLIQQKRKALREVYVVELADTIPSTDLKANQIKNLHAALLIENDPSYGPAMFKDIADVLRILEIEPTGKYSFKDMYDEISFPENYESPGFQLSDFVKNFSYHPIEYWKEFFSKRSV